MCVTAKCAAVHTTIFLQRTRVCGDSRSSCVRALIRIEGEAGGFETLAYFRTTRIGRCPSFDVGHNRFTSQQGTRAICQLSARQAVCK